MTKRMIGLDISEQSLRLAILTREQGRLAVLSLMESPGEGTAERLARLHEDLLGDLQLGDRVAACLPGHAAFVRQLTFPFSDRRKIDATLPFELSAQLPVNLDNYTLTRQLPIKRDDGTWVTAAATKTALVRETLEAFDCIGLPLHVLDISPFAYVAGLREYLPDGVLVCAMDQGASLALVRSGEVLEHRELPIRRNTATNELAKAIHREARALTHSHQSISEALHLMGPLASMELIEDLSGLQKQVSLLSVEIGRQVIDAPFLPAVALALRAEAGDKGPSFNLRQGQFAMKGAWGDLRKAIILATCLACLTLLTWWATMGLTYYDRQRQVSLLEQKMKAIYQKTFPEATAITDVPLQFKSAIRQLHEDIGMVEFDRPSALQILMEVTERTTELNIDVDEMSLERDQIRLAGSADSFEAVNRMAEQFRQSLYFSKIEVAESKTSLDGHRVNYRLLLTLAEGGLSS